MAVTERIAFFVTNGFEELVNPDAGVYRESFAIEGLDFNWTRTRLEDLPKTRNTHDDAITSLPMRTGLV